MTVAAKDLTLVANTIRGLAMDAVQKAESGHPGMPMGMAEVAAVLWTEFLRWSPQEPQWAGRDRFVLSGGHGSMLLYSLLHLAGFPLPMDELKRFRQLHSKTPGHPEYGETVGVETTTGPLGQGFANAVGFAIGAHMEAARFQNPQLLNRVFVTVGDGDLMEGISYEAATLAGHLQLGNLVCLFDDNGITIEGHTDLATSEDIGKRFEAQGWSVQHIDGHDTTAIRQALQCATAAPATGKPQLICCKTTIGKGSPNKANTHEVHGAPLGKDEVAATKQALGMPAEDFWIAPEAKAVFAAAAARNEQARQQWHAAWKAFEGKSPELAKGWRALRSRELPADLLDQLVAAAGAEPAATRALSGNVLNKAAELVPGFVSGSADLDPSTKTRIKKSGSFSAKDRTGRTLHYGIREHAMGAVLNGITLHGGFLPAGSTFLVFADYMRTPIRLASLMHIPTTFVFTHDSLMVGEDGPTHQPVEHLATLRLIPNLHVFRPADGAETAAAWTHALSRRNGPVALALTRQNLDKLPHAAGWHAREALRGGYVLVETKDAKVTIVATGAEVSLAVAAATLLGQQGVPTRVVSMPCVELFLQQDAGYRSAVLGKAAVFAVEMGRPELWCQFTGRLDRVIGQSTFGASAPAKHVAEHFGFSAAKVAERVKAAL
ncbi:MAG: transketolase [Planctomycetes bacterium]|nr:transketolase [Planctomycetota bacterium]